MEIKEPKLKDLERVLNGKGSFDESKVWLIKGTRIPHYPTEPAIQYRDGDWTWYWMGKRHRWDGPALRSRGHYEYWIHGKELTKEEWERHPLRLEWLRNNMLEGI